MTWGPARLAERERQPHRVPAHTRLPGSGDVLKDHRRPGDKNQTIGNQIVVEPDGTLIDGTLVILNKGGKGHNGRSLLEVAVMRSSDGGTTWSSPIVVSPLQEAPVTIPGKPVRTGDILPEVAVNSSTGTLYAAWQEGSFSANGIAHVAFSQSTNGGLNWSTPIHIDQAPATVAAFTPVMHVAASGRIGVTYYDQESATAASPGLTDVFIVSCSSKCTAPSSWAAGGETRLDTNGPFDMTTAPNAGGLFTGDYEGLTSSGNTFDALFVMTLSNDDGTTDLFFDTAS